MKDEKGLKLPFISFSLQFFINQTADRN